MTADKTTALIIRQADFSESSRVITWFTADWGKVATVAKGAKRLKGPFAAALDLLAVCEVVILRKSYASLDLLTEARLVKRFAPAPGELLSVYGGYYIAELLDSLCEPEDPHPQLFFAALTALERLSVSAAELVLTLSWFELSLLRELGHLPTWDACVDCGLPLEGDSVYGFQFASGGVACPRCVQSPEPSRLISAPTLAVLNQLCVEGDSTWQRLLLTSRQVKEVRGILTPLVIQLLGRRPRTLRYLPL